MVKDQEEEEYWDADWYYEWKTYEKLKQDAWDHDSWR